MENGEPRFGVMDGGKLRALAGIEDQDAMHKAFEASTKDVANGSLRDLWNVPEGHYVIVPGHELKDHVFLMGDGFACKYAAPRRGNETSSVDSWIHLLSVIPDLPAKLSERAASLSEDRIQSLLDVMIDVDPFDPVEARIDTRNAELRAEFLKDFPVLDSAGVHRKAGLKGSNTSQTVNAWRRRGRIFGLPVHGKNAYPAFQFDADGQPLKLMEPVLDALPDSFSAWQRAFWFVSPKEDLDGKTPARSVGDGDGRVVETARAACNLIAG